MEPIVLKSHKAPPSTNLRKVIAHSGYTIESAIADIIDNCVFADAKRIDVTFKKVDDEFQVCIKDDGRGMTKEKLGQAMIYAYEDPDDERASTDIGRYSIGLKSASSSFCRNLLVFTKIKNGEVNGVSQRFDSADWGYDEIQATNTEISSESGTLVIWNHARLEKDEDANRALLNSPDLLADLITRLKIYLSKAFCKFMESCNKLRIFVNGQKLDPWSPVEGVKGVTSDWSDDTFQIKGHAIKVKIYTLPPFKTMTPEERTYATLGHDGKIQDTQGFYVYRQNRLIIAGGWLGLEGITSDNKSAYARVIMEFDNALDDYMSVNYAKDSIKVPEQLAVFLKRVAKIARRESLETYNYVKGRRKPRKNNKKSNVPVWSVTHIGRTVKIEINENNPLLKTYVQALSEKDKKALFSLLSKTYPTLELNSTSPALNDISEEELKEMLRKRFNDLTGKIALDKIFGQILSEEPFCNEKYHNTAMSIITDILDEAEGIHDA